MGHKNKDRKTAEAAAIALSDIGDKLHEILAQLDVIQGAEIIAIRIEEAISELEATNGLDQLRFMETKKKVDRSTVDK